MRKKEKRTEHKIVSHAARAILIFSTLLTLWLFFRYKNLNLNRLSRLTFVVCDLNDQTAVFSFEDKKGLILKLPAKEKINLAYGFGEYELGKIYLLGELEKKGGMLLIESIRNWLSIPIFGYFVAEEVNIDDLDSSPKKIFTEIFLKSLAGKIKTNLNKFELISLYLRVSNLNELQRATKDSNFSVKSIFEDRKLREEAVPIGIFNATNHAGLAQKEAAFLEKVGGRVVRVADKEKNEDKCKLSVRSNLQQSYTFYWLKHVYNNCQIELSQSDLDRADINLSLGENEWKKLNQKW